MDTLRARDGTTLAYQVGGRGPALLVVGGALSDKDAVLPMRPLLERHFTVVAFDRRGRGESGDTSPYAVARELEDIAALLETTGARFVYGHSSGAILSLRAVIAGVHMDKLAVNEPPFIVPGTRPAPAADLAARLQARVDAADGEGALRLFLSESVGIPAPALEQMSKGSMWSRMVALGPSTVHDATLASDSAIPTVELAKLALPMLVLSGTASFPWIAETAHAVAEAIPGAALQRLEGQTHSPTPEVLAPVLARFFLG